MGKIEALLIDPVAEIIPFPVRPAATAMLARAAGHVNAAPSPWDVAAAWGIRITVCSPRHILGTLADTVGDDAIYMSDEIDGDAFPLVLAPQIGLALIERWRISTDDLYGLAASFAELLLARWFSAQSVVSAEGAQ